MDSHCRATPGNPEQGVTVVMRRPDIWEPIGLDTRRLRFMMLKGTSVCDHGTSQPA